MKRGWLAIGFFGFILMLGILGCTSSSVSLGSGSQNGNQINNDQDSNNNNNNNENLDDDLNELLSCSPPLAETLSAGSIKTTSCASSSEVFFQGIRFSFSTPRPVGIFMDGTPFVVGPVTIVKIDPPSLSNDPDGRRRNGAMLDPALVDSTGFDNSNQYVQYDENLNVALDVSPEADTPRTLTIQPGHSLLATTSIDAANNTPQLANGSLLTVVDRCYANTTVRPPPWAGVNKIPEYDLSHLNLDFDVAVQGAPNMPNPATTLAEVQSYWLDYPIGWASRMLHPMNQMPNYGREIAAITSRALLMAITASVATDTRRKLRQHLFQKGLDLYGGMSNGGWLNGVGGHNNGRWPLMGILYLMTGEQRYADMLASVDANGNNLPNRWSEKDQYFIVQESDDGVGGYTTADVGMPDFTFGNGVRNRAFHLDEGANSYRFCCTTHVQYGGVSFLQAAGLRCAAKHEAYFQYIQERFVPIMEAELANPQHQDNPDPLLHSAAWHMVWGGEEWAFATYKSLVGLP